MRGIWGFREENSWLGTEYTTKECNGPLELLIYSESDSYFPDYIITTPHRNKFKFNTTPKALRFSPLLSCADNLPVELCGVDSLANPEDKILREGRDRVRVYFGPVDVFGRLATKPCGVHFWESRVL